MRPEVVSIWRRNLLIWFALTCLLLITLGAAYIPLGAGNLVVGLVIAIMKASLVVTLFMELFRAKALIRLAAGAGLFWLVFLFALTLSDVLARLHGG
jgi:cytochrome c oxidase subunit 4